MEKIITANSDKLAMVNAFIAEYDGSLSGIQDDLNNTINKLKKDKRRRDWAKK